MSAENRADRKMRRSLEQHFPDICTKTIELTINDIALVKKSLSHSIESGQFFFNMEETELLRRIRRRF